MPAYEDLFGGVYLNRRVMVTGHTGFKGSWITYWLLGMGAEVTGYALEPPTEPSLFNELGLAERIDHHIGDVRDLSHLRQVMQVAQPEIVFHLAAQPIVRASYDDPVATFDTNVMGTVNLLEAVRATDSVRAVVNVTSDKCYENREWEYAYRENDPMGGYDPYSASKGCAELATASYRRSFFSHSEAPAVATARAGNVVGGGDWAADRIVPDCVRALHEGETIVVRNPDAQRPWQHVLEPTSGYLLLGARLFSAGRAYTGGWNFGPQAGAALDVRTVVETVVDEWGGGDWIHPPTAGETPHEAHFLKLDIAKACDRLGWKPLYDTRCMLRATIFWYRDWYEEKGTAAELTSECLAAYVVRARENGAVWTR